MNHSRMRAAIYSRVSTKDKGQDVSNQVHALKEFCQRSGYEIAGEYSDHASGAKIDRAQFLQLFEDARQRKFDVVVFWALDRFSREGVLRTFELLEQLDSYGVVWRSYTEPHFDSSGPMRQLLIALFSWIAAQERERITERVRAGLDRAKREGKKLGGPCKIFDREAVKIHYRQTKSARKTAAAFGISKDTVARLVSKK